MESAVISDKLKALIDGREVKAATFTTYTFEPEFFELEVIPLLLPGDIPFSSDSRVKEFQVREALRDTKLSLDVFYDLQIFRKEGHSSPTMEYLCHGVHRGNNAFHAKLILILVYDQYHEHECLLVGAGSNNLTRAGWWDNIECQHWEVVRSGKTSRAFLNRLRDDVAFLQTEQYLQTKRDDSGLDKIAAFLRNCSGSNQADAIAYYGINHINQIGNFPRFIRQQTRSRWSDNNWTLEIISPFFAENTQNREHEFFFNLGVERIHVLLPIDQEGNALCHPDYFKHIDGLDSLYWADWSPDTKKSLGMTGQNFRRLHAKIYHFYNLKQSWAFVGSVNFSHKAMRENIEAGFFVELPTTGPLLKLLKDPDQIEHFHAPTELVPGVVSPPELQDIPQLHLAYDWIGKTLTGATQRDQSYKIGIFTPEGDAAIEDWVITGTERNFEGQVQSLESLLKNGSLVKVAGHNTRTGEPFPAHTVMLQQTGWSHKPLDMPDLTPEQILAIYAEMAPERRQLMLMNAQIRKLVLEGAPGEITAPTDDFVVEQFFSEYAEIFHAFRRLKQRLGEALTGDNHPLVDYYLTGAGMDSLPTLIEHTTDNDNAVKPVTAYLLLLCTREIYKDRRFLQRPLIKQRLREVEQYLRRLKSSNCIQLEDNESANRKKFFKWFEAQFSKDYKSREAAI